MVRLTLHLDKSLEENASLYYDKAKKMKKKICGAREALAETERKFKKLEKQKLKDVVKEEVLQRTAKKEWYEKFRWFTSSEGFLVIGGRDATTNEILVKKHTDKGDLVFHTDMIGSPFFVIKADKEIGEKTIKETADATVTFSRAWKLGMPNSSVFYCKPEQLTKEAPSGEYVPRGGFITKGKLAYVENNISCAIGIYEGRVMAGPLDAVKKHCEKYVEIVQGREKASGVAKYAHKKIGGSVDDIVRVLPSGGCKVK
ncbi:MAG: NFACT RNA binding domain-containing protein [Nanoarchaeota archaeon]|nr:NFACT RNA binding domain-containing protein [Nanoarchaeota archaeon]